jgi:hypothetical protein
MSVSKQFSKKVDKHRKEVWKIIDTHKAILKPTHINVLKSFSDNQLNFITLSTMPNCIEFCDNATLEVTERIELIENKPHLYEYSYQYKKDKLYFRYEKQQGTTKRAEMSSEDWDYYHPLCHLHVNDKTPRYGTHETNFFEVFHLIRLNFY